MSNKRVLTPAVATSPRRNLGGFCFSSLLLVSAVLVRPAHAQNQASNEPNNAPANAAPSTAPGAAAPGAAVPGEAAAPGGSATAGPGTTAPSAPPSGEAGGAAPAAPEKRDSAPAATAAPGISTAELASPSAGAEPAAAEPTAPPDGDASSEEPSKGGKSKKKRKEGIKFDGRVMARAELSSHEATVVNEQGELEESQLDSFDLLVHQARLSAEYQSPLPWLSAEVGIDASSGKVEAKDAFVQAKGDGLLARMGQFRVPTGSYESTSSWQLPTADRGFLHDLLVDRLQIGGRRPGVLVGATLPLGLKPRILAGAFQGSELSDASTGETDIMERRSLDAQSQIVRIEAEGGVVHMGAFYERRVGVPEALLPGDEPEHFWTAGADIAVDWQFETGGLRFWVDGFSGESWFEHSEKEPDDEDAVFLAGRAVVALRLGGIEKDMPYVEPYARAGALDPDLTVVRDAALDVAVGVNVGFWRRARLTLEAQLNRTQDNFPETYALEQGAERRALILQAGVGF